MILLPESDVEKLRGIADALDPLLPDRYINPTTLVSSWCVMTILLSIMIAGEEEMEEKEEIRREEGRKRCKTVTWKERVRDCTAPLSTGPSRRGIRERSVMIRCLPSVWLL